MIGICVGLLVLLKTAYGWAVSDGEMIDIPAKATYNRMNEALQREIEAIGVSRMQKEEEKALSFVANETKNSIQLLQNSLNLPDSDVNILLKCFDAEKPFLPKKAIADIFQNAKEPMEYIDRLISLAMTGINSHLINEELSQSDRNSLAADCFYFMGSFWGKGMNDFYTWLQDLQKLPYYRQYPQQCDELMTMAGKLNTLSTFSMILPSFAKIKDWAMYRMAANDRRRFVLSEMYESIIDQSSLIDNYMKYFVRQEPRLNDLLSHGHILKESAGKMTYLSKECDVMTLHHAFGRMLHALHSDVYPYSKSDPVMNNLFWRESKKAVTYRDVRKIAKAVMIENRTLYETRYVPDYQKHYEDFQKFITPLRNMASPMEISDDSDHDDYAAA